MDRTAGDRDRRRRGADPGPDLASPGPDARTVVQAVVRARLLGLRLLTLDARVVVGSAPHPIGAELDGRAAERSGTPSALAPVPDNQPPAGDANNADGAGGPPRVRGSAAPSVAQAAVLLEASRRTLDRTR